MRLMFGAAVILATAAPAQAATLVHAYEFNDPGTMAFDSVGTAHGTLVGGATISSGFLRLDGINDYVQFSTALLPTNSSPFSLYVDYEGHSLQRASGTNPLGIVEIVSQRGAGGSFFLGQMPDGRIRLSDAYGGGINTQLPSDNLAHDLLFTFSGGLGTLYLNGTQVFSGGFSGTNGYGDLGPTQFGTQYCLPNCPEFFQGNIDSVRVFSGVATVAEARAAGPVSAVPEPATWLMFMMGVGLIGGALRQSNRLALSPGTIGFRGKAIAVHQAAGSSQKT